MHAQSFNDLLSERELLVCVGPGGVGKTTCAAALGLGSAQLGYRTLVLTIDPARRLASMLGLSGLDDTDREVPLTDTPGTLHAAMLDTGSSYDALIHRVSPDPEHREQIYNNRIYQLMSRTFGASHAYVAMERLHSAIASGAYERIILDTPPTRNALDILDAPGRLSTFLDEGALQWFVNAPSGGLRQRLMARGGVAAGRLLQLLTGQGLVDELREFLAVFMVLRQGFRQRAEAISARLRAPQTGFVLVTSPQAGNLEDAAYLHQGLASRGIATQAVVCNRAHIDLGSEDPCSYTDLAPDDLQSWLAKSPPATREALGDALNRAGHEVAGDNHQNHRRFDSFVEGLAPPPSVVVKAPVWARELQSVGDLAKLAATLKNHAA